MLVTMTLRTLVLAAISWYVAAKFSTTNRISAPESISWCSSSRAVYSGLTLTIVQPARSAPNRHTGYCRMLGIISATREPFLQPCPCSHAANAAVSVSSSEKVIDLPMQVYALRLAYLVQLSSNTSRIDAYVLTSISAGTPLG